MVLKSPKVVVFEHALRLNFLSINNKGEYETFLAWPRSANKRSVLELFIFRDSKLVVNQVISKFEARGDRMAKYLATTKILLTEFRVVKIKQVWRDLNSHIDELVGLVSVFEGENG